MFLNLYDPIIYKIFFIVLWFVISFYTFYMENKLRELYFISIMISSFITAICAIIFAPIILQLIIFLSLVIIIKIIIHPKVKRNKIQRIFKNQICVYIGREAVVTKTIQPNEIGEISFSGYSWEAISLDDTILNIGDVVLISGKSDCNLIATKL